MSLLDTVTRAGPPARAIGARLDILRSAGLRYAWRRLRDRGEERRLGLDDPDAACRAIWHDAAAELGATVADLTGGFLEISRNGSATRVWRHHVMLDDIVTQRLALDKALVHRMLTAESLPVPSYVAFDVSDTRAPLEFLRRGGTPCVVKPASGTSGGKGVTGGVLSPLELSRARLGAARYDRRLLIERQIPGEMHRLLVLDGELLDVVRRRRPTVIGDGRSAIAQLIAHENRRRIAETHRSGLIRIDLDCVFTLASQRLQPKSVPAAGQTVIVKTASSENRVEDNETVHEISPGLASEAVAAVRAVGLRLGGVDAVTPDASRSLAEAGGAIVEVNGTPGLDYHYDVADPARATRVAVPILRTLLERSAAVVG